MSHAKKDYTKKQNKLKGGLYMGEIPEWLRPYCESNAYKPTKEDIESLEPQSRREMLLKYAALNSGGEEEDKYATFKARVDGSLTEVTAEMLQGITSIVDNAFSYCTSLASIEIPNSVTSIGYNAFYRCTSLASITIPNSVTSIVDNAFSYCSSLSSVTIPSGVTSIGQSVFYNCTSLTSIEIPNGVTSIGQSAFQYCTSLASVTIPNSVTSIGWNSFGSCSSLTSVEIPNSVTKIATNGFYNCQSLASVTVKATTPPTLGDGVFSNNSNLVIYVPAESVDAYKAANNWSTYASKIQAIPNN